MLNYFKKTPHRNHLEFYLKKFLPKLSGSVLDIGSGSRRYDFLIKEKPAAIDLVENLQKDIKQGDINNLNFNNGSFDNIVCIEVLEYVETPEKAVEEIYRVLSENGTLILSVPYMYKFHKDQIRFSEIYLKDLFSNFKEVNVYHVGNAYSIILDIVFGKIKEISFTPLRYILTLVYLPFTLFLSRQTKTEGKYASGYFLVAKK